MHKSWEIFLWRIFQLSSIYRYGGKLSTCLSSKYVWCKINLCTHIWKDDLGRIFWPWLIFERQAIAIREQRLDVRDVLATCEMGIRLLVKAMKRWFWNGDKSGRKSNGKGDYNIKASYIYIPERHSTLPWGVWQCVKMGQIKVANEMIMTFWPNILTSAMASFLFVMRKIR